MTKNVCGWWVRAGALAIGMAAGLAAGLGGAAAWAQAPAGGASVTLTDLEKARAAEVRPAPGPVVLDLPAAPAATAEAINAFQRSLPGDVRVERATSNSIALTLEDAIARGLKTNLQIELGLENERRVRGLRSTLVNALLPTVEAQAYSRAQEINLVAFGLKRQSILPLLSQLGPGAAANFSTIIKVNSTDAQVNVDQQLFNVPAYFLYRAAQRAGAVANYQTLNVRGNVALEVGTQYLQILADAAIVENARAQVKTDQLAAEQARQRKEAGVGINLDALRSAVQLQTQQQALINAENNYAKDKIALTRLIGLPADQDIVLSDTTPYADLAAMPTGETLEFAYTKRKDLLSLQAQMDVAERTDRAVRYERLPTIAFSGFYGVLGETTGLYHGVFSAQGSVNFPIFKEAQFRGEREVARAQLLGLRQQIESLKVTIDEQIRSNRLDVESANDLVKVARSNVELSRQELLDSEERFRAGVTDTLPLVEAQATVANAESNLVQRLYQYNVAKLTLARSVGVVESEGRAYLGR